MYRRGISLAVLVLLIDQLHKWLTLQWYESTPPPIEVTPFFNLVMVWNKGISFGMFRNADNAQLIFSIVAILISAGLLWWMRSFKETMPVVSLGLIVGGALGNVIDRLYYGAVADFFDFHVGGWHWPAFNIADSCVVVGAILLSLYSLFFYTPPAETSSEEDSSTSS